MELVVQKWEESERGWGNRPDGYSLHLSEDDRNKYISDYWDRQPKQVPDEYERPCGTPYVADVDVDDETLARLQKHQGVRFYKRDYPGDGGKDGWVAAKKSAARV